MSAALKKRNSSKEKPHVRLQVLAGLARQLLSFHGSYRQYFQRHTVNISDKAYQYVKGLFQAGKKNMERMEEKVPGVQYDPLQHFLSDADWDWRPVTDKLARDADKLLGGFDDSALYIDETGIPKKGKMSVGVSRQWCGQLGKTDNCQVAVFATLGRGRFSTPIDCRLYLPSEWTDDRERCLNAKIPEQEIVFKSKHVQAIEMVLHARSNGVRFNWVGCDGFYGSNPAFLRVLDECNEQFVADVHCDQRIYVEDPKPVVPAVKSKRGRKPSKLKAQVKAIRVDKWVEQQPDCEWRRVAVRDSSKGKLVVDILHQRVWLWDGDEEKARLWHLIVRREANSPTKKKYSLSNASDDIPVEKLAYMQAQRYWVERPFQDGKNECGLGDYQARGWLAWHHHMTLVMMAMLFMLDQRIKNKKEIPLLSCADIATVLKSILPQRDVTESEVLAQLEKRHRKRQASIDSAYEKQNRDGMLDFAS